MYKTLKENLKFFNFLNQILTLIFVYVKSLQVHNLYNYYKNK